MKPIKYKDLAPGEFFRSSPKDPAVYMKLSQHRYVWENPIGPKRVEIKTANPHVWVHDSDMASLGVVYTGAYYTQDDTEVYLVPNPFKKQRKSAAKKKVKK
jgi:hypothetical protein